MKKTYCIVLLIVFTLFLSLTLYAQSREIITVLEVIDGDTLRVNYYGQEKIVKLVGIDTPENRVNTKAQNDANRNKKDIDAIIDMGKIASDYVSSMVKKGDKVALEFDVQFKDRYERLLGYVFLENGKMLNEEIVKAGYASPVRIPPNLKYKKIFMDAFRDAKKKSIGFWRTAQ
ncbi:MAG: thermonuclease family protein [Candidatus Brocadiaceae bacterium]|nr:thermonuclease family protein [Candidatus Brocadiaceae bacterium]